jgi:phenylalanyl-tRNA synthetase beta subunit
MRILGARFETHQIVGTLNRLGFELIPSLPIREPSVYSWRLDVEREIDGSKKRLHGYNNFPNCFLLRRSGGGKTKKQNKPRWSPLARLQRGCL